MEMEKSAVDEILFMAVYSKFQYHFFFHSKRSLNVVQLEKKIYTKQQTRKNKVKILINNFVLAFDFYTYSD